MTDILQQLIAILGSSGLIHGQEVRDRISGYWGTEINARTLMRPATVEEMSACLKVCHEAKQPLVTIGGLTGCVRGCDNSPWEYLLSTDRMNRIEGVDVLGRTITVEAGCSLQSVQKAAEQHGLMFPIDLGARGSCTIGGNVATNAGGIQVIRHGMIRSRILGLEAVLADGTILSSMNSMIKNNAGYDLKQLFIGSEGTLGIVTRVVLRLSTLPTSRQTALVALNDFTNVLSFLKHMSQMLAGRLSAYEVMWQNYYSLVTESGRHRTPLGGGYPFYVLVESHGSNPSQDEHGFQLALETAFDQGQITDAAVAKSYSERDDFWAIREDIEPCMANKPTYLYDISIGQRDMWAYVKKVEKSLITVWPGSSLYILGHVGDGNLHLFFQPGSVDNTSRARADHIIYQHLQPFNGSVSAEHGIGIEKKPYLKYCRSEAEINLMRVLKKTMDANNILNPGKIFDMADLQESIC